MSAGFVIAGERVPFAPLTEVTVGDQIRMEQWLRTGGAELTDMRSWEQVLRMADEVDSLADDPEEPDGLTPFERQRTHPEFKLSLIVGIWVARRHAGQLVTPGECADFTLDQLDFWSDEESAGKG